MARTLAQLPAGSRITDYISLGVIAKFFPAEKIHAVLEETKRASVRERDLPAHVVVYYVIALALYMQSSYREVLQETQRDCGSGHRLPLERRPRRRAPVPADHDHPRS
ncbi:MAG TPA: transposase domain-containing protein [Bryobacteraceae bacterium]